MRYFSMENVQTLVLLSLTENDSEHPVHQDISHQQYVMWSPVGLVPVQMYHPGGQLSLLSHHYQIQPKI